MTYDTGLTRKGPGLLVRDLVKGKGDDIAAALDRITALKPDILALQSVDADYDGIAVELLQDAIAKAGHKMPHAFAAMPNTGVPTGFDLDRNGKLGEARDAQGYGTFRGQGGMVLLSRFAVIAVDDHSDAIWSEMPNARLPKAYFNKEEMGSLRLHSVGAWDVQLDTPIGPLHVLVSKAGPPVFDGPEDRNGLRNADEIAFWTRHLDRLDAPFVILAGLNNDLSAGEGLKPALRALLSHARVTDPEPQSDDFGLATVNWKFGNLRVDYVLPSSDLTITASGVDWLAAGSDTTYGSRHRPVWVDISGN